jgi:phosphatidylglycerophosphate synthase
MTETPKRIQRNVLAAAERRLLTWLCSRMPRWVTPDRLTGVGMAGSVMVFVGYTASAWAAAWLWLTIFGYLIQWFGDSMDGSLARFRQIERPNYGYFLDHSCDGIATVLIIGGIGCSPFVRLDVSLFAAIGYLLLSVHAYLAAKACGEFKLSYLAAGPTELRLMLIGLTLAMLLLGHAPGIFGQTSGFDIFVAVIGAVLAILFLKQSIVTGRQLALLEP